LKRIQFTVLKLRHGDTFSENLSSRELGLVVLGGVCSVKVDSENFQSLGQRKNVFDGRAYAVYIPGKSEYSIGAESDCEIALCYAPWQGRPRPGGRGEGHIKLITPEENKVRVVGRDNWQREVVDLIDSSIPASSLLIGETYNPPGHWSSYPPHKHDVDDLPTESQNEEFYFFKIHPRQGFGIQRVYTKDGSLDETCTLQNNDAVMIPKGYHPVVAAAGYQLYYLWVLSGEKRVLAMNDDPDHQWLKLEPLAARKTEFPNGKTANG
jgi:5-deoxy-glucuronate isomerase